MYGRDSRPPENLLFLILGGSERRPYERSFCAGGSMYGRDS